MPPVTVRDGALATKGTRGISPDHFVVDMMERPFQYDPAGSPTLTIVTKRAQVRRARSTEVKHLEDDVLPEWDMLNGGINAVQTTVVVDNPMYHREGDLIKVVSTGETMRVLAVNTSNSTLDVERSWGATPAAIAADNADLLNMGAAELEGDLAPIAKATVTVTQSNYTQIVKTPVHVTKTLENVELYGGPERTRQRAKAGARHARHWEHICLHGEKREDISGGYVRRSAGGLDERITTNVLAAGGGLVLTESQFGDFVGDVMRYSVNGSRTRKILLASRELIGLINSWGTHKLITNSSANATYGINITTYISGFGTLDIINHPLLELGYAGYGYILDMDGIWYRPARRTTLETNIQATGEDAFKDQYLTEATFSFALEKAFGKITGVAF
jgi:hypothetical protein